MNEYARARRNGPAIRQRNASFFRWGGGDWNVPRLGLIAHAGRPDLRFVVVLAVNLAGVVAVLVVTLLVPLMVGLMAVHRSALWAPLLAALMLSALLAILGGRLVHQVQHAKIVLGMLKIAFGHHPVANAGRVAAQLQIFLEQLLSSATHPHIRAVAVEDVIAVHRNAARGVMADRNAAATSASSTATPARAMVVAATHAFHVHTGAVVLSRCGAA